MTTAPVCPVSHSEPTSRRFQPPGVDITHLPHVSDLKSVINVLNQMNNVVQHITRGTPQINNVYPTTITGVPAPKEGPNITYGQVRWREIDRQYETQKLVNPDDKDQSIPIKTLARITWQDDASENRLVYEGQ
jgi:hypothetical protein